MCRVQGHITTGSGQFIVFGASRYERANRGSTLRDLENVRTAPVGRLPLASAPSGRPLGVEPTCNPIMRPTLISFLVDGANYRCSLLKDNELARFLAPFEPRETR